MTIIRVIDFETTGMGPDAQVCEAAFTDLDLPDLTIQPTISWLCSVDALPPEVRAVHHIRMVDLVGRRPFQPHEMHCAQAAYFAAHNAEFEQQFINPGLPWICTYKAALRVWPDAPSHSNGALRYWLEDQGKIELDHLLTQPAHRAGPDTYVTAGILSALINEGIAPATMADWTLEPRLLPRCTIGKFRNKPWAEVEYGFLDWMLRQADMEADLKWNAQRELDRRAKR